jgi:hypothetical protein
MSDVLKPQIHSLETTILRPEDLKGQRIPTVSLHLLVKNGESCVGRLLDNVGPYIHEVVAVVNDTTDNTADVLSSKSREHGLSLTIHRVSANSNPEFYILDVPETYEEGVPLADEKFEGPFTEKPLLADWSGIRNLGWRRCVQEWRLFLDADDVVVDPESIPGLCLALEANDTEMGCSKYQYNFSPDGKSQGDSYRERLVKNVSHIEWAGITHEHLSGSQRTAHIDGSLVVRDLKDSTGEGIRVPGRCFKILYHHARVNEWRVSPRNLVYMMMECRRAMPDFALKILDLYLRRSTWPEERAWACAMGGEVHEAAGDHAQAVGWYQSSLAEHPGAKSAFRLCRTLFQLGRWEESVVAYHQGVANKATLQLLDNGTVYEDASKILAATCLGKLGKWGEAIDMCQQAIVAFPKNEPLKLMLKGFSKRKGIL